MSSEYIRMRQSIRRKTPNEQQAKDIYKTMSDAYRAAVNENTFIKHITSEDKSTFLWYDYETWGVNTMCDQASQFASVRTNQELDIVDIPNDFYCIPSPHRLPHPIAVQVTHLSPLKCKKEGIVEYKFFDKIKQEKSIPQTCSVAYNGIKFDSVLTRFAFYRNLFPAYEHEHLNGNSRWDTLMVSAMFRSLRPEGITWPTNDEGKPSLKLELLAPANNIVQVNAHSAIDDTLATVDWARCLKKANPKLWNYLFENRTKRALTGMIKPKQSLLIHTNMSFGVDCLYTKPVFPLFYLPKEPNVLVAFDLTRSFEPYKDMSPEELNKLIYSKKSELEELGIENPPLVKIKINTCPAIAPLATVRDSDAKRLGFNMEKCRSYSNTLSKDAKSLELIQKAFSIQNEMEDPSDVEQQLYSGDFFTKSDQIKLKQLHTHGIEFSLDGEQKQWDDDRIENLIKRVLGKNYPEALSTEQLKDWKKFCLKKISTETESNEVTTNNYRQLALEHIKDEGLRNEYITFVEDTIKYLNS